MMPRAAFVDGGKSGAGPLVGSANDILSGLRGLCKTVFPGFLTSATLKLTQSRFSRIE